MRNLKLKIKKCHLQYHQKHEVIRDKFDKRSAGFFHSKTTNHCLEKLRKTRKQGEIGPLHAPEDSVLLRHLPTLVCRFSVILALDTPTVKESESFCRQMTWWRFGHWLHRLAELVSLIIVSRMISWGSRACQGVKKRLGGAAELGRSARSYQNGAKWEANLTQKFDSHYVWVVELWMILTFFFVFLCPHPPLEQTSNIIRETTIL